MAKYRITADGATYDVEAPDERAAIDALDGVTRGRTGASDARAAEQSDFIEVPMLTIDGFGTGYTERVPRPAMEGDGRPGVVGSFVRGGAQGFTLGSGDEVYAAQMGAVAKLGGEDYGSAYDRALEGIRERNKAAEAAHPWAYGAGKVMGNVAGIIPVGMTSLGARALGMVAGPMTKRMGASAISGGAMGGAQGYLEGEAEQRLPNAAVGAGFGAGIGAVTPVAGALAGHGINNVVDAVAARRTATPGLGNAASRELANAYEVAGGPAVRAELERLGPDALLLDAAPAFQGMAQGLASRPGPAQDRIVNALTARNQGTNARLAASVDDAIGPAPIPSAIEAQFARQRRAAGPMYDQAFEGAGPVDPAQALAVIESRLRTAAGAERAALIRARDMLTVQPEAAGGNLLTPQASAQGAAAVSAAPRGPAAPAGPPVFPSGSAGTPSIGATIYTPNGRQLEVEYRVVDAGQLTASHLPDLRPNPNFPAALQPRDRTRAASEHQILGIARNLQPERLGASVSAMEGAPIIGADGLVESGNARILGIRRAYQENGPAAQRYRDYLERQGYDTRGIAEPVLVRVRKSDMAPEERVRFAQESNASPGLAVSASERAATDAQRLAPEVLSLYRGGDVGDAANRDFVRAFIRNVAERGEEGAFVTRDGALSLDGAQRVRNALLQSAYGDSGLVARLAETGDENVRAFGSLLSDVAGDVARLRQAVAAGEVVPGADLSKPLLEAAQVVAAARQRGVPLAAAMAQQDAFGGITPEADGVLRLVYGSDLAGRLNRARATDAIRAAVADALQQSSGARLFGSPLTAQEILAARHTTTDAAAAGAHGPGAQPVTPAGEPLRMSAAEFRQWQANQRAARNPVVPPQPRPQTDAGRLHGAKGALDAMLDYGDPTIGVPAGAFKRPDAALVNVRRALNDALENQVPGYAEANLRYRTAARASEALESGKRVLDVGERAIHPADFVRDFAARPIEQQAALRAGVRADLDRMIGTKANDLQALRQAVQADGDWNRAKLAAVFGDDEARRIFNAVDRETAFRQAYERVVGGSQTAQRTAGQKAVDVRGAEGAPVADIGMIIAGAAGGAPGALSAAAIRGFGIARGALNRSSDLARNTELGNVLVLPQGTERDVLLEALQRRANMRTTARQAAPTAARLAQALLQAEGVELAPQLKHNQALARALAMGAR